MTLSLGGELPSLGLHKPRGVALHGDLSNDRAVDRGVGRLAAGRLPIAPPDVSDRADQFFTMRKNWRSFLGL